VPPPLFDGRAPSDRADDNLRFTHGCVERAGGLLVAVPAYWAGVSGVFKNLVDVLCGPAYDLPQPAVTVLSGKPTALLVVGADAESARAGVLDAERVMTSAGARLVTSPVSVANPRAGLPDAAAVSRELVALGAQLALAVHGMEPARC
jgi:NAD(P)H-dependent FMN reductase